mmetsp:Transcript_7222/g.28405  ORF Transcript_7222/g.28405 Transcript_7222/m.28405 type:complete len:218 (+) Transcript_7222:244-897(+)
MGGSARGWTGMRIADGKTLARRRCRRRCEWLAPLTRPWRSTPRTSTRCPRGPSSSPSAPPAASPHICRHTQTWNPGLVQTDRGSTRRRFCAASATAYWRSWRGIRSRTEPRGSPNRATGTPRTGAGAIGGTRAARRSRGSPRRSWRDFEPPRGEAVWSGGLANFGPRRTPTPSGAGRRAPGYRPSREPCSAVSAISSSRRCPPRGARRCFARCSPRF